MYRIGLTMIPGIGDATARVMVDALGSATAIFEADARALARITGIGEYRVSMLKQGFNRDEVDKELKFIEENNVQPVFITDSIYPKGLREIHDAPVMLYFNGEEPLSVQRLVAIIGTRNCSDYGMKMTRRLVEGLQGAGVTVVSGLAYGIDIAAHQASLAMNIPTIGVVAHGLDLIYPPDHRETARRMRASGGGLLTEFRSGTQPERPHFPMRNRIVAGMADVTVVIETDVKGGAMITAKLAADYNKEVAAFPGNADEKKARGCNYLLRKHMAHLITSADDLLELMNWDTASINGRQPALFPVLNEEEQKVATVVGTRYEGLHIDDIQAGASVNSSHLASLLLSLELQGVVQVLPGKRYRLNEVSIA